MGKTVLITGASRGIGREAALRFCKAGYRVGINYNRSKEAAAALVAEIAALGGMAEAVQADVSDFEQAQRLSDEITCKLGPIDVLINNAGIAYNALLTDTPPDVWARIFSVNAGGAYNCSLQVLPGMIERQHGCIINVSSMWGVTGASCEVAYSASKAALIGLTKALAKEAGPSGVRVNCIAPGVIATEMNAALSKEDIASLADETPLCRIGTPGDVAALMLFLASDDASFITGQVIGVDGGFAV